LKTAEGSASNGNQGGPTSAKSTKTNHGIPVFTEERANIKKNNQNVMSLSPNLPGHVYFDNEFIIRKLVFETKKKDVFFEM